MTETDRLLTEIRELLHLIRDEQRQQTGFLGAMLGRLKTLR